MSIVLGFAVSALGAAATAGAETFEISAFDQLQLRLRVEAPKELLPFLPLLLELNIANLGNQEVTLPRPTFSQRDRPYYTADLFHTIDGGQPQVLSYVDPAFGPFKEGLEPDRPGMVTIGAGESLSTRILVSYDWKSFDNPEVVITPGAHRFQVRLYAIERDAKGLWMVDRNGFVQSNAVEVQVAVPRSADAAALERVGQLARPWSLAMPNSFARLPQEEDYEAIQRIATEFPTSAYAVYAKAALAQMLAVGDPISRHPKRPADPTAARALLDEALADPRLVVSSELQSLRQHLGTR